MANDQKVDHEHLRELLDDDNYPMAGEYLTSLGIPRDGVRAALANEDGYRYPEGSYEDLEKYTRKDPNNAMGRRIREEYGK